MLINSYNMVNLVEIAVGSNLYRECQEMTLKSEFNI